jgi:hypothetical protein
VTRIVVVAVFALAAVAAADTIRPETLETSRRTPAAGSGLIPHDPASDFALAGSPVHNRVLHRGREYLSPDQVERAFPAPLPGAFFQIAHLAAKQDGTVAIAIYGFPAGGEPADAIQVWKDGNLEASFRVPPGTFGGGIGFADEGRLIGALSPNRLVLALFTLDGSRVGHRSARG